MFGATWVGYPVGFAKLAKGPIKKALATKPTKKDPIKTARLSLLAVGALCGVVLERKQRKHGHFRGSVPDVETNPQSDQAGLGPDDTQQKFDRDSVCRVTLTSALA